MGGASPVILGRRASPAAGNFRITMDAFQAPGHGTVPRHAQATLAKDLGPSGCPAS